MSDLVTDTTQETRTPLGIWLMDLNTVDRKKVRTEIMEMCMPDIDDGAKRMRLKNWRYKGLGNPHWMVMQVIYQIAKEVGFSGETTDLFPTFNGKSGKQY